MKNYIDNWIEILLVLYTAIYCTKISNIVKCVQFNTFGKRLIYNNTLDKIYHNIIPKFVYKVKKNNTIMFKNIIIIQ